VPGLLISTTPGFAPSSLIWIPRSAHLHRFNLQACCTPHGFPWP
jgi:hypothetical protein